MPLSWKSNYYLVFKTGERRAVSQNYLEVLTFQPFIICTKEEEDLVSGLPSGPGFPWLNLLSRSARILLEKVFYFKTLSDSFFALVLLFYTASLGENSQVSAFIDVTVNLWKGNQEIKHIPSTTRGFTAAERIALNCPEFYLTFRWCNLASSSKKTG